MNRKRIRQMNTALLRRLTGRPTAEYFSGQPLLERLESENYIQRFVPLYDGTRLRCGDVLPGAGGAFRRGAGGRVAALCL